MKTKLLFRFQGISANLTSHMRTISNLLDAFFLLLLVVVVVWQSYLVLEKSSPERGGRGIFNKM